MRQQALVPMKEVKLHLPFAISGYTDFYSSKEHATNVGVMFRGKDNALQPNWLHMPIGYNGRASTVVVSGTKVRRPRGQLKPPNADAPSFGPCRRLDFELEMGVVVGQPSALGEMLTEAQAEAIFRKWGLDFAVVGETTPTKRFVVRYAGAVVADAAALPRAGAPA